MPEHPGKKKKKKKEKKSFMEKLKQRRKELESGDARGGKRAPKDKRKKGKK